MRIRLNHDGRVFEGTPIQIIEDMKSIAFGQEGRSVEEYIDWVVGQIERFQKISVNVTGQDLESKATSFVEEMITHGLARILISETR